MDTLDPEVFMNECMKVIGPAVELSYKYGDYSNPVLNTTSKNT